MPQLSIVGLADAWHQKQMLPLRSHLLWWTVAGAAAASLVVAFPQIQRFLFVFDLVLVAAHLNDAMTALWGAHLVAGGGGFCEIRSFRLSGIVLLLDDVGPCHGMD